LHAGAAILWKRKGGTRLDVHRQAVPTVRTGPCGVGDRLRFESATM